MSRPGKVAHRLSVVTVMAIGVCNLSFAQSDDPWRPLFDAGKIAHQQGKLEEAEKHFLAALEVAKLEDPPGLRTAVSLNALATLYIDDERFTEADEPAHKALEIFRREGKGANVFYVSLLTNVGELELALMRPKLSQDLYEEAVELAAALEPADPQLKKRAVQGLFAALCAQDKIADANAVGKPLGIACVRTTNP